MTDSSRLFPDPASAVAVVGMAGRFPGAGDLETFWTNLRDGVEGIRRFSRQELIDAGVDEAALDHPAYVRAAAPVDGIELFDARFFGFSPRDAEITDPQQRLLLECAWEAFESAGHVPGREGVPVGVFAGASLSSYLLNLYTRPDVVSVVGEGRVLQGNDKDFVATWISYKLDLRGPGLTVQSACSTSLAAVHLAVGSLLAGECDLALAGGASLVARQRSGYLYREGDILSPDGRCRAFDAEAAGTVGGNGVGVVLLRRLEDALREGDPIRAVLLGSAVNNDGAGKVGYTAPSVEGQARAIAEALALAGVEPAEIDYVEAHGTGTTLGDPVEVAALNEVFAPAPGRDGGEILLGSVKSSIGHLDAAAGVAGLIKTILALEHRAVPPSLHFRRPNPRIDFASGPFRVAGELRRWPSVPQRPRRAGVSSFGIGGTNAHVVVQEAPPREAGDPPLRPRHPLLLSARSPAALAAARDGLASHLEEVSDDALADVAFTLQLGRRAFEHRWAAVCADRGEALELLRDGGLVAEAQPGRKVDFLFPGQGSHHPGMGADLYAAEPTFRAAFDRCADLLAAGDEVDLRQLLLGAGAAAETLGDTAGAQPALFALGWALAELWESWGIEPRGMLGHSLGEYVAACRAGVFELEAALRLVAARGRLMASVPPGSMLGVGLSEDAVATRLEGRGELALAAVNGPVASVVSGPTEAVERLAAELRAEDVAVRPLHTSHAFHSPMMDPILEAFGELVETASPAPPKRPYVSNLTGDWADPETVADAGYWVRHLRRTVRFGDGLGTLAGGGGVLLEVGPGNGLTTLARGAGGAALCLHSLPHPQDDADQQHVLLTTLGRLWAAGVDVDWERFHAGERRRRAVLPTYPFERRRYWVERGTGAAAAAASAPRAGSRLYLPSWRRAEPPRGAERELLATRRRWLLFSAGGLGRRLVDRLRDAGQEVVVVDPPGTTGGSGHPAPAAEPQAYARMLADLDDRERPFHRVVHLWSAPRREPWTADGDPGAAAVEQGVSSLAALLAALGEGSDGERDVRVVTSQVAPLTGEEELCPAKAALSGPCLVAPQEYPHLRVGVVEVPPPRRQAAPWEEWLLGELVRPVAAPRVALRSAARWVPTVVETTAPAGGGTLPVRGDGFYLVTGGTGLVGSALAEELARQGRERGGVGLLLISRSGSLDDERRRRLTDLGARVEVCSCDVAEPGALARVVADGEELFGPLRGVVHAAGVVGPESLRPLGELEPSDVARILRPKVDGTRHLVDLVAGRDPDFVILTGSLSALLGGLGHAAYSAANCYLAATAEALRGPWMVVDWDGWSPEDGPGDDGAITRRRGGRVMAELLPAIGTVPRALVSSGVLEERLRRWVETPGADPGREEAAAPVQPQHSRPELEADYVAPRNDVEERMAALWSDLLGVDRIGADDDFFALGGQSLLATRLFARLRQEFGVSLPLRAIFEHPTVGRLAAVVAERLEPGARDTIPRHPRDGTLPLSFAQQRLWFLDRLDPGDVAYLIRSPFRLRGPLSVPALRRAAAEIVRRHEVLRTRFRARHGVPEQVIDRPAGAPLLLVDLSSLPPHRRDRELRRVDLREGRRPFDLERGPLVRLVVVRSDHHHHVVLATLHHIVTDLWSQGLFVSELSTLYAAFVAGEPSPLEELPIQYADYAAWQRRWLEEEGVLEQQLGYWTQRLRGAPPVLDLPTDRPRPKMMTSRGGAVPVSLPPQVGRRLGALARRRGVTPFMVLLAGFKVLLSRWSGSDDVVVGAPVAGRNRAETEALIGFFVNTLVLRTDLSGEPTFDTVLERVKDTTLEAMAHQDLPFERLVDELEPDRQLAHSPLFQVAFALQDREALGEAGLPGLEVEPLAAANPASKFDLTLMLVDVGDSFEGSLEYNRDLFDATTADRMARALVRLLGAAVDGPERPASALRALSRAERHQVAVEWPARRQARAAGSIPARFLAAAATCPDAIAVSSAEGRLTYGGLERRSARLAAALRRRGAGAERRVGLCMERGPDLVVTLLAVLRAGAAYVPLDPDLPPARLAYILEDCAATLLLADGDARLEPPPGLERLDPRRLEAEPDGGEPLPEVDPGTLAYVIYTSGSTGRPKGSPIEHRNVTRLFTACDDLFDFGRHDVWTLFHSYAFDFSVWEVWGALFHGARLHVVPYWMSRSPEDVLDLLRGEGVTVLNQTPSAFRQLVTAAVARRPELALRWVIFGGEALEPSSLGPWFEAYGDTGPRLVNMYGITETTVHVTWHLLTARDAEDRRRGAIGRALPDLSVRLRDSHGRPAAIGVAGEILVGGAGLGRGYLDRPRLTAERFVPGGDAPGRRLYRSGDLARWRHDGTLEFLGRIDQQVKVRGFRIEPAEIESVLGEHGALREAVVIADDHGGSTRLVAYVVAAPGEAPAVAELRRHLSAELPDHMVPALFITLDALPLTAHGKLDRRALPSAADVAGVGRSGERRPPEGDVEQTLAQVWRRVLGIGEVGRDESFFELGGDSILSIQVVSRAREAGIGITPRQIFEHRSIASLAAVATVVEGSDAEQGAVTGEVPLSPIQRWFFALDPADRHHWNQALLLALEEPLSPGVLARALDRLLRHHDALRARFERMDGGWRQRFAEPVDGAPPPLTVVDLAGLPETRRRAAVEAAARQGQGSLDLERGPLLRALLLDLGRGAERLFLAAHHLVVDGVSWRILLQDLHTACSALTRGLAPELPAKTTSYRRWAERLREHAVSGGARDELDYWRRQAAARTLLPLDHPEGEDRVAAVRLASEALDAAATEELLREVPAVYGTEIHEVLLAAVGRAVAAWTGAPAVRLDLEGHGREEIFEDVDLSRTVGWFTAIHPLVLDVDDEDDGAWLKRVKETVRAVPRRGVGYGLLRWLDPETAADLASLPTSPISFNYLGQVDRGVADDTPFRGAPESAGPSYAPRSRRPYPLAADAMVTGGVLRFNWSYGSEVFDAATIDALARRTLEELRRLIEHCRRPEAGGFTPSDFPRADLDHEELDELFAELSEEG